MAARKIDAMLLDILKKWHPDPDRAIWDCHGTWVIYHKAVEAMAATAGISFDMPIFAAVDQQSKNVAIVVAATLGDKRDWATGEASPQNNKNSYPFAMAEKRARDRVAIKLLGLHGVYSEDEADDFKEPSGPTMSERAEAAEKKITAAKTDEELKAIWRGLDDDLKPIFRLRVANLGAELKAKAA